MNKIEWVAFAVAGVVVLAVVGVPWFWGGRIQATLEGWESGSTVIRNFGLIVAGVLAIPFLLWRTRTADRQAQAAREQVDISNNQTDLAQQTLMNERYQKGSEMLGNAILSVRLGGIYALERLAKEFPDRYHVEVMKLFCAFVRFPSHDPMVESKLVGGERTTLIRQDVQAALDGIGNRTEADVALEERARYKLDLAGVVLLGANLESANFSGIDLRSANLAGSALRHINLSGANLREAVLSSPSVDEDGGSMVFAPRLGRETDLAYANLSNAILVRADVRAVLLQNADLSDATMLATNLSHSDLSNAALSKAALSGADLTGALLSGVQGDGLDLYDTILSGADLSGLYTVGGMDSVELQSHPMVGLNQGQLDRAVADPLNPPKLNGVVLDAETGNPLEWRGSAPREPH